MAYFPFFIDISNKVCVVVGGGRIACRKIELLLEFKAAIIVIAPEICMDIHNMCAKTLADGNPHMELINRKFMPEDIEKADILVAATNDTALNSWISRLCREKNKLVNVIDGKEESSFIFPAVIKRGDFVVAVSTGGNCPTMAARVKQNIETLIPEYYGALTQFFGDYREIMRDRIKNPRVRKRIILEIVEFVEERAGVFEREEIEDKLNLYR